MKFVWSAVIALGVAGVAYANDDEAKTTPRTYTQAEVEALLDLATRVTKLEDAQQDAEMERLKKMAEKEKQDDRDSLPGRVSTLEKKMGSAGQTWDASKMLTFSTPDGNFTAKIGGRIYVVYRHINDWDTANAADTFLLDTARFQLDGTFYKDFFYRVEGEAKSATTATSGFLTKDVFIGWQGLGDWFAFQAGQFKMTFSQEETTSSRFIDFAERSIVNRLVPGHVQGVRASGSLFEKSFEWYLGISNGSIGRDGDKGNVDGNDEKDYFGRFFFTPMKTMDVGFLKTMRLGYDFSWGKRDAGSAAAPGAISSGDLGVSNILTVNAAAGTVFQGNQARQDINFSWNYGSMNLRAEYIRIKTDLDGNAATTPVIAGAHHHTAWYVSSTYILTGEEKTLENRIKPAANFSPLDGNWGAWELAARWAVVNQDNDTGVAGSGNQTHTTEYTFGVNWWMTPNVIMRVDWEHLIYDRDIATGFNGAAKRYENLLYIRWQIDF